MQVENFELGTCCACGTSGPTVRHVVMLDKKSPTSGRGWGCIECGLPAEGALAVTCDACLASHAPLRWACRGWPSEDGRVPIEALVGRHAHDPAKHPELRLVAATSPVDRAAPAGWRRLAPGMYEDEARQFHLVIDELLAHHGVPNTPENREEILRAASRVFSREGIQVEPGHALGTGEIEILEREGSKNRG